MDHPRYDFRKEPDGSWTVFDVFTGWPAKVDGLLTEHLDLEEADDLTDLLNYQDGVRRGTVKPQ